MEALSARRRRAASWLPVALYAGAILTVSSIPAERMPASELLWSFDKLIHACEYAVLSALVFRALSLGPPRLPIARAMAIAIVATAAFGCGDEYYQTFTGRAGSALDALADAAGAFAGGIVAAWWRSKRE